MFDEDDSMWEVYEPTLRQYILANDVVTKTKERSILLRTIVGPRLARKPIVHQSHDCTSGFKKVTLEIFEPHQFYPRKQGKA